MSDVVLAAALAERPGVARRRRWRRRYGLAALGGIVVLAWFLAAIFAPLITPYPPDVVNVAGRLQPPSAAHWLGTDALGRDVLTRVIYGARISLTVGFVVVLLGGAFGTLLGAVAAYARGSAEEALMRVTDLVFCFPPIILAMAIAAALGIGTRNTMIAMLVVWWPKFARLARSLVIGQRSRRICRGGADDRVRARRISCSGRSSRTRSGRWSCWSRSISATPSWCSPASSFLGLGVVPPTPEWGSMVAEGRELVGQWWVATFPGPRDPHRGDRLQLRRRRHPRLARPACATTLTPSWRSRTSAPGSSTDAGPVRAVDGVSFRLARGRDAGDRRRVRLGQERDGEIA